MASHPSFHMFLGLVLCVPGLSQTVCNSTLTGTFTSINVNGSSCTLDGVDVQILSVVDGGSLRTLGPSRIFLFSASNAGNIHLLGTTSVRGPISFMNSGNIRIGRKVNVSELVMRESGILRLQGRLMRLQSSRSGKVVINGGILDGSSSPLPMFVSSGNPSIQLCGATIGRAQLGSMSVRIMSSNSPACPPSVIRSLVLVEPKSSIVVRGVNILETFSTVEDFELRVEEMSISLTKVNGTVTVENVGKLSLTSVTTGESVSLSNVQSSKIVASDLRGDVTIGERPGLSLVPTQESLFSEISASVLTGDVSFGPLSGMVTITGSEFSNKTVEIRTRGGAVLMNGNNNLNIKIHENSVMVKIQGNKIGDGVVSNNEASVKLTGNTFETLSCSGNDPSPALVDNIVVNGGTGQCNLI